MRLRTGFVLSALLNLGALSLLTGCAGSSKHTAAPPALREPAPTLAESRPEPKIEETLAAPADPEEALVRQVEGEYSKGKAEYSAGHLGSAKRHFNRAFNLLLESDFNLHSNERLMALFQQVVESVHRLEMAALKAGDGFSSPRAEPAPIDEASQMTFPVDPAVAARAEQEVKETVSDLPLVLNETVAGYIQYFSSRGRATMEMAWTRAGRYRKMISRILTEEGVPQDLIFLAQAESGFSPFALSRAGARGMWQFMGARAREYGLERDWWTDERQDPEKATRAAARHLRDLYEEFGDWYLAMAAYNSGPQRVRKAVASTGYADFWELYRRNALPRETRNYVPIILAVAIMSKNPEQYGLDYIQPEPALRFDTVAVNYPVDLRLVAECVDASVSAIQELNPSLLRSTTPRDREYTLRLPAGTASQFESAIAAIPRDKRVQWRYHKVTEGETLSTIAKKYRTATESILEVNDLPGENLNAGSKLIIPVTTPPPEQVIYASKAVRYRVRRGDTVLSIADRFSVDADKLRQWNRIKGNRLRTGAVLRIYPPVSRARLDKNGNRIYIVRPGDTLSGIAAAHGTTVSALKRDNRLRGSLLHPGDRLVIRESR